MCLTHSEAKQTKTLQFGPEKGLLQGHAKRMDGLCSKTLNSPMFWGERFWKARFVVKAAGCVNCFWLVGVEVTGGCSRKLVISLKLSSSTWLEALVQADQLRDTITYIPWEGTKMLPQGSTIVSWFLLCFCILSLPWFTSVAQLYLTLCEPMNCSTPGFPVHLQLPDEFGSLGSLLKLMSIESVMPSNYLIPCHPLLLPPSIFPSIRVFFKESVLHIWWPKYRSFSFRINPSNEYSGLISFRTGWISLQSKGLSRVFSNTTVQKHQFFGAQLSL